MSAKDPMRLADMQDAPRDLQQLASGVRALREHHGNPAEIEALAARLGPQLTSNVVAGTALVSSALLRFMMIGAGVLGLGLGTWLLWPDGTSAELPPPRGAPALVESQLAPSVAPAPGAGPVPEIPAHAEPSSPAAPVAHTLRPAAARRVHPKPARAPARPDPEAELALLGRAQALLDSDPKGALSALAEHAHHYRHGVFSEEREVLAIEAENKLGLKDLARARAERFMARFPRSAHARRVRTLLEPAP